MTEQQFLAEVAKIKGDEPFRVSYITEDYNIFGARLISNTEPFAATSWASAIPVEQAEALDKLLQYIKKEAE